MYFLIGCLCALQIVDILMRMFVVVLNDLWFVNYTLRDLIWYALCEVLGNHECVVDLGISFFRFVDVIC